MFQRVMVQQDPYLALDTGKYWYDRNLWPCRWVTVSETLLPPFVAAYRLCFRLDRPVVIRAHVTADERYELFLDGKHAARGSERGSPQHWFYESYDLSLPAGDHVIVARVWSLGSLSPWAQMSTHHGFLFAVEREWIPILGTGTAPWEAKVLPGYSFIDPSPALGTGANLRIDGSSFAWGFRSGLGEDWHAAQPSYPGMRPGKAEWVDPADRRSLPPAHFLVPAALPPMFDRPVPPGNVRFVASYDRLPALPPEPDKLFHYSPQSSQLDAEWSEPVQIENNISGEQEGWKMLLKNTVPVTVPPHTRRRVLIDLCDYYCAYPRLLVSGGEGSSVTLLWAESLYEDFAAASKGQRDAVEGKFFYGCGDTFLPDGGEDRVFDTLWWQCGRFIELRLETGDNPLTIARIELNETRYPLEMQAVFRASDPRYERAIPILLRGLQMCSHETYVDCPYYEQLMYVGDTRLEALVTYAISGDGRLPRKALQMFDESRLPLGLTQSRFPSHVTQIISPFSLWYVGMVYDYARWCGDREFILQLMLGLRNVLDTLLGFRNQQGLIAGLPGWNFIDWSHGWNSGIPPEGDFGASGPVNWMMVLALGWAAQLEGWLGEPELSQRWERLAEDMAEKVIAAFWDPGRLRFSDVVDHQSASEHSQALAILSGRISESHQAGAAHALLDHDDLTRATIYMRHYLLEAFYALQMPGAIEQCLALWFDLEKVGLKTTPEASEPTRSDCHGWGSTPLYHFYTTLLGIRPDAFGFERVLIAPQPGSLTCLYGVMPHPLGEIEVCLKRKSGRIHYEINLPVGLSGSFQMGDMQVELHSGLQAITLSEGSK